MPPRIAIPMPHSIDHEYGERAIPQYENAIAQAGGEPVRILLGQSQAEMRRVIEGCDAVLLPGSNADVNPAKFGASRALHTADADVLREAADELLLRDAYDRRKPVLGICYGLQSLNVFRAGSLIQHIPDFLTQELRTRVNHEAGKNVAVAHEVEVAMDSKLASFLSGDGEDRRSKRLGVNSSHHQSAHRIGSGLRVSARCMADGIVEAVEGTDPDHFVIAVQWHPERSQEDAASRAIFRALIEAAEARGK